ncbi:MAG: hypothetical protein AAF664_03625 [Planctomycetota bacterium]
MLKSRTLKALPSFVLSLLVIASCTPTAEAAFVYELGFSTPASPLAPGDKVTIDIVIRESDNGVGATLSPSITNGDAISAFSGQIVRDSGDGVLSNLVINPVFLASGAVPDPNPTVSDDLIAFNYASFSGGLAATSGSTSVTVGTFDLTGGTSDTVLRTDDFATIANDLVLGPFGPSGRFDQVSMFETLTVVSNATVVPEPASGTLLMGFAAVGILAANRRRRD